MIPGEENIPSTDRAILKLLKRLLAGDASFTQEEEQQLLDWEKNSAARSWVTSALTDISVKERYLRLIAEIENNKNDNWKILSRRIQHTATLPVARGHRFHFFRSAWFRSQPSRIALRWAKYAAAIIICIGAGAYFWTASKKSDQAVVKSSKIKADVPPGGEKAILTLADGTEIILDSAADGSLAQQGSSQVVKLANGRIVYNVSASAKAPAEAMWNTMSTPAGGQYQVILPDGTKVWLNATSSITYPTAFNGNSRTVKIKGEVYFEVSKNKLQPFIVDINGKSTIEVLGTSFNISSYANEGNIKTTLLEGGIRVINDNKSAILKPGQQATINIAIAANGEPENIREIIVRSDADLNQVLAWKNGMFNFDGADLQTVMRQLERWYDIKVQYRGPIDKAPFKGKIDRSVNLSDVLERLQEIGVNFELQGKTLIVLNNRE